MTEIKENSIVCESCMFSVSKLLKLGQLFLFSCWQTFFFVVVENMQFQMGEFFVGPQKIC